MAIRSDELKTPEDLASLKIPSNQGVTLDVVRKVLMDRANQYGLPIEGYNDQIKSGGLLNRSLQDCLVVHHRSHMNDYFKYCFVVRTSGIYTYVEISYFGISVNTGKEARREENKGTLGGMLKNAIFSKGADSYKEEYDYYEQLHDIIKEAFSG